MTTFCIAFYESYLSNVPLCQSFHPVLTQLKLSVGPGLTSIVRILCGEDLEDRLENTLCAVSS